MQHHSTWATSALIAALCATTTVACGTLLPTPFVSADDDPDPSSTAREQDPHPPPNDSTNDGRPAIARRCNVGAAFVELNELRSGAGAPSLTNANGLTMSSSGRGILAFAGTEDTGIVRSVGLVGDELVVPANPGGGGGELDALQSFEEETLASLSGDARVVIIDRRSSDGNRQPWVARRDNADVPFNPLIPIRHTLMGMIKEPFLMATGSKMYFTLVGVPDNNNNNQSQSQNQQNNNNNSQPSEDLWVGDLDVMTGNLQHTTKLALSTSSIEGAPVASTDDLEIFYTTNNGRDRLFHATRASTSVDFGPGVLVPIPGEGQEDTSYPTWISPDACDLYILGVRNGSFSLRRLHRT